MTENRQSLLTIVLLLALSCPFIAGAEQTGSSPYPMEKTFLQQEYFSHLKFLSSDLLEGRGTGSRGSALAAEYISAWFRNLGLKPAGKNGEYRQIIPFQGFDTDEKTLSVSLSDKNHQIPVTPVSEICIISELPKTRKIHIQDDLLFVGYGIEAPEHQWNDFKDVPVAGKILVMLVNDPEPETSPFKGESLTYYGRWTYKIEMARRKKARGLILLHNTREATYGWNVVKTSWAGERVEFRDENTHPLEIVAWLAKPALNRALSVSGLNYTRLKKSANSKNFRPFVLPVRIDAAFHSTYRRMDCANVAGIIPGTDDTLKDQAVLFTAHYDHLGTGIPNKNGDTIYNGALDNASGTAAVLCLARAFAGSPIKPARTLIFLPVTGEELGLLGSTWYARHPIVPLKKTAVVINKDCMNHFGRRNAFSAFPVEYSTATEAVRRIGAALNLELKTHGKDIGGGAFRSDHFPFASRGVTALSVGMSGDYLDFSPREIRHIRETIGSTYHSPDDEIHCLWDYRGIIQELKLLYRLGRHWADGAPKPHMKMSGTNPYIATSKWYGTKLTD